MQKKNNLLITDLQNFYGICNLTEASSEVTSTTTITMQPAMNSTSTTPSQTTQAASILPTATATTPASTTTQPATVTQVPTPAPTSGRKFDGASFVGGIILGIVLTGIFIFAFKWWQTRNKSYHSL